MAKGFNKVILMGNLTRDPENRSTTSGQSVTNFSLAVNRSWRGQDGTPQDQVSFFNCVAWGKAGETISQYVKKGSPLLVTGRLDQRTWEDKSGQKRSTVEVVIEDFNFIGGNSNASQPAAESSDNVPTEIDDEPIDLSEIPF